MKVVLVLMVNVLCVASLAAGEEFGPSNPFYAPSKLPFQAPAFDKIKNSDYQPAIEAGMAEEIKEIEAIANNPAAPTFDNTIVAMEKSGQLLRRVFEVFSAVSSANTNDDLQKVREIEAPKMAAHADEIYLNPKLFQRVKAVYEQREKLKLDAESLRLVEYQYKEFVRAGANLNDAQKAELKKLNEELATLSNTFVTKLLAATKNGAFATKDKAALAGLTEAGFSQLRRENADGGGGIGEGAEGGWVRASAAKHHAAAGFAVADEPGDAAADLRKFVDANREGRRERHAGDDREDGAAAGTARGVTGIPESCGVEAGRPDGENAGRGAALHG